MTVKKKGIFKTIITRKRDIPITSSLSRKNIFVHNGKTIISVKITKGLIGTKLGSLALTKKLGKSIHNSERNKKRKNKKKNKK